MDTRLLIFLIAFLISDSVTAQNYVKYVDPLIGTAPATTVSALRHSAGTELKGQTFPAVGRPFGMTLWTPETRITEAKCVSPYYYDDTKITGFRGSHWMSGSCTQDYGTFSIMPFISEIPDTITRSPVSGYNHANERSSPYYYSVLLNDHGILAELTATSRSAMMRFTYPGNKPKCIAIRANSDEKQGMVWYSRERNEIAGFNPVHRMYQGWGQPAGFSGYFVFRFSRQVEIIPDLKNKQMILLKFNEGNDIMVKAASSFTSIEAARNNLDNEIPGWNFELVMNETESEWNKTLGKIEVKTGSDRKSVV